VQRTGTGWAAEISALTRRNLTGSHSNLDSRFTAVAGTEASFDNVALIKPVSAMPEFGIETHEPRRTR